MADTFGNLNWALDQALSEDPDRTMGAVRDALLRKNIRCLMVTVDDQHPEPLVATTVRKTDVTESMVNGMVYTLLEQAGISNPGPQATIAAKFVSNYVRANVRK